MCELDGKEVENITISGVDTRDYPDFSDAFISSAIWVDTGEALTDDEIDQLEAKYPDVINELAFESCIH